ISSTLPRVAPSVPTTAQPRSITYQETGSDGTAADVPDRALRVDRLCVRQRPEHAEAPGDPLAVQPLEAALRHLGRGAVAIQGRDAETEGEAALDAGGVHGRDQQCAALEVIARAELDLGIHVAPVGRQRGLRLQPLL